jgi:hypothetical protein
MNKKIIDSDNVNEIELIYSEFDNELFTADDCINEPQKKEQKYLYVYNHIGLGHIFYKTPVGHPTEFVGKIKLEVEE